MSAVDFRPLVRARVPPLTLAREPEIVDEIAQHLRDLYDEARSAGLSHDAAVASAASALPELADGLARDIESASRALPALIADKWRLAADDAPLSSSGRLSMLTDLRRDVRYAVQMFARTPALTLTIVVTLALGIGANTVIFSAVDALLLRQAPVADPERLVSLYTGTADGRREFSQWSYPDYVDLRDSDVFEGVAVFASIAVAFDAGGQTEQIAGEIVSGNYFDVLGVGIPLGRGFRPEDDRPGHPARVAVVSHAFWLERFGGDPGIVNGAMSLNGAPWTVIGVAPAGFRSPIVGRSPDIWVPMSVQPEVRPPSAGLRRRLGGSDLLHARGPRWLAAIGRLREGTTLSAASSALDLMARRLQAAYPDSNRDVVFAAVPLGEGPGVRRAARPMLGLLSAAVGLVLLIACTNVANLLLARAVSRRRELAVRMALGAGRGRLLRQWLTESVLLAILGAAAGIAIAYWGIPVLYGLGIPASVDLGINMRVLAFTLLIAVASGILFGLAPVFQALRTEMLTALREEGGAIASGTRTARLRRTFVVAQVALSLMLLIGAGLFLRTLQNAYAVDLGYTLGHTLLADLNLDIRGYSQASGQSFYTRLLERLQSIPGVDAAAAARVAVLSGAARTVSASTDGQPPDPNATNFFPVRANVVSDRYFAAMDIELIRGRQFTTHDGPSTPPVAIVSRSLADRLWPGRDPIGQRLVTSGPVPFEVVGVVPDTVYLSALERNPPPFFYLPLSQNYESGVTLHLRTTGDPRLVLPAVRQAVRELDPQLALVRTRTLTDEFETSVGDERMMAGLIGSFGALALVLAAVGLYSVMAHVASQRRTEIGIRLALGARRAAIVRLVMTDGLWLVAIGAAIGLAGAVATAGLVRQQLFGVQPVDPATYAGVAAVLVGVGALACAVPAWRATRIDPANALRNV